MHVVQESLSACRGTSLGVLLSCLVLVVSCAGPNVSDDVQNPFGIYTADGLVLCDIENMAKGVTHTELTRLIRAGVSEAYPVECGVPPGTTAETEHMVWRVTNNGRKATAVVHVVLIRDGHVIRSAFADLGAPGANPDRSITYEISHLAQRVLAAGPRPTAQSPTRCIGGMIT